MILFRSVGWVGGEIDSKANLSQSLVELELEVGVGFGFEVGIGALVKMQLSFLTFLVRWVGGEMEIKAYLIKS